MKTKKFEYIIEFAPVAMQSGTELCFESKSVQKLVRCKNCRHRDPEDHKCDCGGLARQGNIFPVDDDYFCAYGEE